MKIYFNTRKEARQFVSKAKAHGYKVVDNKQDRKRWSATKQA